ncbi:uncharacterized protein LOC111321195 [Stylophora pistillata]|uniref:Uncharacterized protein n=1 Tax=Stylophora pistillata TaxID=50429 RepID=A0A2B4SS07_STYPI|nr:uncharacterized protein LOC111321195 [Stylophora pistillata]PFX32146.1 hypothetical protein AWC38_SpisGene2945 [Stylophora pistillata]
MGNDPSKKGKEKATHPKIVSKGKNSSKNLRLLILHEAESKPPIDAVDHFCDALNACKPPGSLEIKQEGVKILELDGSSSLSGSFLTEAKNWIIEWLDKDGVVLICLLSSQDVHPFAEDINFQGGKIVAFSFGKCPTSWKECISLKVDLKAVSSPSDFEEPLKELVATVRAE